MSEPEIEEIEIKKPPVQPIDPKVKDRDYWTKQAPAALKVFWNDERDEGAGDWDVFKYVRVLDANDLDPGEQRELKPIEITGADRDAIIAILVKDK